MNNEQKFELTTSVKTRFLLDFLFIYLFIFLPVRLFNKFWVAKVPFYPNWTP